MRRRHLILIPLLGVAAILTVTVWIQTRSSTPPVTVELSGVSPLGSDEPGSVLPRLWVTNHTGHAVIIIAEVIEVQDGTSWHDYEQPTHQPLWFYVRKNFRNVNQLRPHESAPTEFVPVAMPLSSKCRLRFTVLEQRHGLAAISANIMASPRRLWVWLRGGTANSVLGLFGEAPWKESKLRSQVFSFKQEGSPP